MSNMIGLNNLTDKERLAAGKAPIGGPKKVRIAFPFYRDLPKACVALREQLMHVGIPGYEVHMLMRDTAVIVFGRNELRESPPPAALPYDYLFMIDTDTMLSHEDVMTKQSEPLPGFPNGLPLVISWMKKILDHQLDICGGLYVARQPLHLPHVYEHHPYNPGHYWNKLDFAEGELIECDALGTGFICIKREVLDRIDQLAEENQEKWRRAEVALETLSKTVPCSEEVRSLRECLEVCRPNVYPAFWIDRYFDPLEKKWKFVGEDIYFCRLAKSLGFRIFCDTSVQLGHQTDFYATYAHFKASYWDEAHEVRKAYLKKHGFWKEPESGVETNEENRPADAVSVEPTTAA